MKKREDALKRSEGYSHEWLIAIAMSIALFLSVGAFIYLTVVREPVVIESTFGFAAAPLCEHMLLYILAETRLLAKIQDVPSCEKTDDGMDGLVSAFRYSTPPWILNECHDRRWHLLAAQ